MHLVQPDKVLTLGLLHMHHLGLTFGRLNAHILCQLYFRIFIKFLLSQTPNEKSRASLTYKTSVFFIDLVYLRLLIQSLTFFKELHYFNFMFLIFFQACFHFNYYKHVAINFDILTYNEKYIFIKFMFLIRKQFVARFEL